jgi:hypothetical protein
MIEEVLKEIRAEASYDSYSHPSQWALDKLDRIWELANNALEAAVTRADQLEKELARAAYVAEHLFQMIDRETWRSTGGDDGQGHYEGDYRAEQIQEEIRAWAALAGVPADTIEKAHERAEAAVDLAERLHAEDPSIDSATLLAHVTVLRDDLAALAAVRTPKEDT